MRPLFGKLHLFFFILFILPFIGVVSCGGGGSGSSASSTDPNLSAQNCGNALLNENESCDDGNTNNSDGCNANCAWEVGEAICGNGVLENEECCEDGNTVSGDGCSSACTKEAVNRPPSVPLLATEPANGATWAPTRLYLSWNPSTDADVGDQVLYDVYFVEGGNGISSTAIPYKKGITDTHFIIQASTDNRSQYFPDVLSPIYLSPPDPGRLTRDYFWKICARDKFNATACSETRVFKTDDSVVGWWRFDENPVGPLCPGAPMGSGKTVCDYSGNNNHGVPNGGPMWLPPPDPMLLGGALQFDGVNDWVGIQNSMLLNPTSISIQAKFRINVSTGGEQVIVDKRSDGYAYEMRTEGMTFPLNLRFGLSSDLGQGQDELSIGGVNMGSNYMFHGTYDHVSKVMALYRNGVILNSHIILGVFPQTSPSSGNLVMSNRNFFNPIPPWVNGNIDEVILYSKGLDEQEVNNNYSSNIP